MEFLLPFFQIVVLIFSVVLHEVSHGLAAKFLGDNTAEKSGRLTLNPISHLDVLGSVILPLMLLIVGGPIIGWAKPVPYNPNNLRNKKWGPTYVALAGPATNIAVAAIFGFIVRLAVIGTPDTTFLLFISTIVLINLVLAIFNLVPIPPLDGSKLLLAVLPHGWERFGIWFERYGFFVVLIFVFFILPLPGFRYYVGRFLGFLFWLITGQHFGF